MTDNRTRIALPGDTITGTYGSDHHEVYGELLALDLNPRFRDCETEARWNDGCWNYTQRLNQIRITNNTRETNMSNFDIPVVAIRNFFIKHDLPLRLSLDNMPDASTMRKIKYRANQLESRWDELFSTLPLEDLFDGITTGVIVANKTSRLRFAANTEGLRAGDTVLANVSDVRIDSVPNDVLLAKTQELLKDTRFTTIVADNRYIRITTVAPERRRGVSDTLRSNGITPNFEFTSTSGTMSMEQARSLISAVRTVASDWKPIYRAVLRQGFKVDYTKPVPTHDTSANLEKYLSNRRRAFKWDDVKDDAIDTLPVAEHGMTSSRTWGIEVEAGGARGVVPPKGWDRKGDGSLYSAYGDSNYDDDYYDDADEEERESVEYWSRYDTGEFVSPILHSFHSKGLEKLVTRLAREPQNDSAGVHVHVGADDLSARQIGGLIFAYEMIESIIEASYRRETRSYCKQRDVSDTMRVLKAAKNADNQRGIPRGDRYVSVNLCALDAHGTIEFRAMGPVYEYEHLIKWAHFCREMVNLAAKDVPSREWSAVKSFDDVRALFAKYGAETPAILFDGIVERFGSVTPSLDESGLLAEV
jgi:hypothetical protein